MLILCLLVISKTFSQNDTENKEFVVLSDKQAGEVIKDLIRYDALKEISALQKKRIENFKSKESVYLNTLSLKDSVILKQNKIIDNQESIINKNKKIQLNSYIGIKTENLNFNNFIFYNRTALELKGINTGVMFNIQPVQSVYNNTFQFNLFIEYKIF